MKLTLAIFSLFVAQSLGATVLDLVVHEVKEIVKANPGLTVDHCTTKCDGLFDLVESHDESNTDRMCHYACVCVISPTQNCHASHVHTTHAPHFTRPHHSTRFPHHTRPHGTNAP